MDPEGLHEDADIWAVLDKAKCKSFVEELPDKLDYEVSSRGQSISKGTRQLLALARALRVFHRICFEAGELTMWYYSVRKRRILCLDEASASLDKVTDAGLSFRPFTFTCSLIFTHFDICLAIQEVLRTAFPGVTVLIVAHRISSALPSLCFFGLELRLFAVQLRTWTQSSAWRRDTSSSLDRRKSCCKRQMAPLLLWLDWSSSKRT